MTMIMTTTMMIMIRDTSKAFKKEIMLKKIRELGGFSSFLFSISFISLCIKIGS